MARLNEKLLGIFPDSITFNKAVYECIAPPIEQLRKMQVANYDENATATFQMRELDRLRAGIIPRSVIEHGELKFEVYSIARDANDSLTALRCYLKQ